MDKNKKTPLEEAKTTFEEIKKFATEAAKKEFENEIDNKINSLVKEAFSITVDDDENLTIDKGDKIISTETDEDNNTVVDVEDKDINTGEEKIDDNDGNEELPDTEENTEKDTEEETKEEIKEDDEPIEIQKDMITLEQDAEVQPAQTQDTMTNQEMTQEPEQKTEDENIEQVAKNLTDDIVALIKTAVNEKGGEENEETEVVIDDEAPAQAPAQTTAPQETPPPETQPSTPPQNQELSENEGSDDEIFEFTIDEIENALEEDEMLEINLEEKNDEDEDYFEFDPDNEDEIKEIIMNVINPGKEKEEKEEKEENEEELEEIKGKSKPLTQHQNTLSKLPTQGTPNLEEDIKAQYESKIDELKKENKRLNESTKEMKGIIQNYKSSFVDLRKQFDEMQVFNAKLAYANKIFANGGLSTNEKARIAEQFDSAKTIKDAEKLYQKIIKENKAPSLNEKTVLKSSATHTAKPKNETIYESEEMKRRKRLAGITKTEY